MDKIKQLIDKIEDERAKLLYTLCENEQIWDPNILLSLVQRARTFTNTIKILKEVDDENIKS